MNNLTQKQHISAEQLSIAYYNAYAKLANSKNTQEGYHYTIVAYKRYNDSEDSISFVGTKNMVEGLQKENASPDTINQYIGRLCKIVGWAANIGIVPYNFLAPDVFPRLKTVEKTHRNVTDTLDFDEVLKTITSLRDRALFTLLGIAGMRKSEVINLNVEDLTLLDSGEYKIFVKNPKNGKQRYAILSMHYADELTNYLESINQNALFVAEKTGIRLNVRSVNYITKKYTSANPHALRHYMAETLFQAGASIDDIAQNLGDSVRVTERVYKGVDINRQTSTANLITR